MSRQSSILVSLRRLYHHVTHGGQFHERLDSERLSMAIAYIEQHSHSDRLISAKAFTAGWEAAQVNEAQKERGEGGTSRWAAYNFFMSSLCWADDEQQ